VQELDERARRARAREGRFALFLLCDDHAVELAEALIMAAWHLSRRLTAGLFPWA
jgi:hypothetical protein